MEAAKGRENLDWRDYEKLEGPPELVVEVLSPSNMGHDRIRKSALYAKFGVKNTGSSMPSRTRWSYTLSPRMVTFWQRSFRMRESPTRVQ